MRICTGGFVVGEDGMGYTDIGEEIDWVNEDAKGKELQQGQGSKKGGALNGKRKAVEAPNPGARARMQKMFQSAAIKAKPSKAPAVDDKSAEALLDDILGNLESKT